MPEHILVFTAVDSSADQAMVHLLAGLEDEAYEIGEQRTLLQHFSPGSCRNLHNSDDEENEPQIEKEEMELSLLMSQRWDSNINDASEKRRYILYLLIILESSNFWSLTYPYF